MLKCTFASLLMVLLAACAVPNQKADLPAVTPDGLHLMPNTKLAAVYMKPGADLSQYDKIALLDTYVAFAKNWQRNYNEDATFEDQVSDRDMKKIRTEVSQQFAKEFTKVLTADGRQFVVIATSPSSNAKGSGPKAGFTVYALPA